MSGTNLILTGMPASGKSTSGVILAKILGMDFLDSDLLIQKKAGKRLPEILAERGLSGFLALEEETVCGIGANQTVIATGGSVIYGRKAMRHLKTLGRVVYLEVPYELLEGRLMDIRQRGVVLRSGQTLRELYDERVPLYEEWADLTVSEEGRTLEETVRTLAELAGA